MIAAAQVYAGHQDQAMAEERLKGCTAALVETNRILVEALTSDRTADEPRREKRWIAATLQP